MSDSSTNPSLTVTDTDQIPKETNPVLDFPSIYAPQPPPEPKITIALNTNVQFVQPKFGLLLSCKLKKVEEHIRQLITEIPDASLQITNPEFVEIIVNTLETLISKKDKVDKEEFLISVLDKIFKLTDEQKQQISTIIEYQVNRKLIKGKKGVIINAKKLGNYIYKKLV